MPTISRFPDIKVEIWPLHEFTYLSPTKCRNTTGDERTPLVLKYWKKCDPYSVNFTTFAKVINPYLTNKLSSLNKSHRSKVPQVIFQ